MRSESDLNQIQELLWKIKIFREHPLITPTDLRDLALAMTYQELEAGSSVMNIGDRAECFYIILDGTVTVQIRNEIIDSWDWAHSVYEALKAWKAEEFDKRVEQHMVAQTKRRQHLEDQQRQTEKRKKLQGRGNAIQRAITRSFSSARASLHGEDDGSDLAGQPKGHMLMALRSDLLTSIAKRRLEDSSLAASNKKKGSKSAARPPLVDEEEIMELTELERSNLNQLRRFSQFDWYIEATKLSRGAVFGELALEMDKKESLKRKATVKTMTKCELAILKRSDFLKVIKKIEVREINNRANFLMSIPYFQHLSANQVKKLTHQFETVRYLRQQFVFKQGQVPTHMYIVVDGDFEILRHKKSKHLLMDPTSLDKGETGYKVNQDQIASYLGPGAAHAKSKSVEDNARVLSTPSQKKANNTLYQGPRGQAGSIRISIANRQHVFGWEDIINERMYTTSIRCLSCKGTLLRLSTQDFLKSALRDAFSCSLFENLSIERDAITKTKIRDSQKA